MFRLLNNLSTIGMNRKDEQLLLPLLCFLAVCCAKASSISGSQQENIVAQLKNELKASPANENNSSWKRLGKIQLDNQEYAEASRIFRQGSQFCPNDAELKHHVQVFETFHGTDLTREKIKTLLEIPPLSMPSLPPSLQPRRGVFLTLDCPQVPHAVSRWKGKIDPDRRVNLIHASREPILSREACQYLIDEATKTAGTRGWTTDRHIHAPTCDIPAHDLPLPVQAWIRDAFDEVLYPLIQNVFGDQIDLDNLRVQDCFIVRYDGSDDRSSGGGAPGFSDLKPHQDESLVSLTIALNDMDEYEGGGLFIAPTQDLLNGPAGTVLCFAGSLVHGGYPVMKGTRWILTAFLYPDANVSGKAPGYTLKDFVSAPPT